MGNFLRNITKKMADQLGYSMFTEESNRDRVQELNELNSEVGIMAYECL